MNSLEVATRRNIILRPQQTNFDLLEAASLKSSGKVGSILNGHTKKLHKLLRGCSVVFLDHYGTTFYFCLAMNTPIICYWSKFPLLKFAAEETVQKLKSVGIVHDDPTAAAAFFNEIADVNAWWSSAEVQSVRIDFISQFFLTDGKWFKYWIKFLNRANQGL